METEKITEIVNWVHKQIPFFQKQWNLFCKMVEKWGEHVDECSKNPELKVDTGEESRLEKKEQDLRVEFNKNSRESNACKDDKTSEKLEAESEEIGQQISEIVAKQNAAPKPGCIEFAFANFEYLNIHWNDYDGPHWITPEVVNPFLWFPFLPSLLGRSQKPSGEGSFLANCVVLAVTHDQDPENLDGQEKHIYRYDKYKGKYFCREGFCQDLYSKLKESRVERAYEAVKVVLQKRKETDPDSRPGDLITTAIALDEFYVSRSTLRRHVKNGTIKDWRPPGTPENSSFLLSRGQLEGHYPKKK